MGEEVGIDCMTGGGGPAAPWVEDALTSVGFGRFHVMLMVMAGICWVRRDRSSPQALVAVLYTISLKFLHPSTRWRMQWSL